MEPKLISHINADSDLVEAWLKYYVRLGIARFHLILHGPDEDNQTLLELKDRYPVIIEDSYCGPFSSDQKKARLDAVLARYPDQWLMIADSDEFVEFPYEDIPETIRQLERAGANIMAAPMLQRLTSDGSLESPQTVQEPFRTFPLCSEDLYRRVGLVADIFKFPLFYCVHGTQVLEEGNHNPPLGQDPQFCQILGVTHHFKFRRTVSTRLEKRINSAHAFREESLQLRDYLDRHSGRLPLDGTFSYSRSELIRRGLLKNLSQVTDTREPETVERSECVDGDEEIQDLCAHHRKSSRRGASSTNKRMVFIVPAGVRNTGIRKHVSEVVRRLSASEMPSDMICLSGKSTDTPMESKSRVGMAIRSEDEPRSLVGWIRMLRKADPAAVIFCYDWLEAFGPMPLLAAVVAGVHRRFAMQYLMPIPVQASVPSRSPQGVLRRIAGKRVRRLVKIRVARWLTTETICSCRSIRDALVHWYAFPPKRTVIVYEGVSTEHFRPCLSTGQALRTQLGIGSDEVLLICVARLAEEKGLEVLIHALSRVLRQGIRCKCLILGEGPLKEQLRSKVNRLGLGNFVRFEGYQRDVRPYLQAGSAFVLTSLFEGLPVSVLEAMACGLPCIVTDVGGNAEIVNRDEVGVVIRPGSVEEAERAIIDLATHPSERAAMGAKAREVVRRSFDIDYRIEELRSVLLA